MREFLLWCLPALLVGFALRALLTAQMPFAIYHVDTGDLMTTPYHWVKHHRWIIHGKKTFLVPATYTLLALLKIPIMLAVPFLQHLMGLAMIGLTGLLCRLWFERWRVFIVPVTMVTAVHPAFLWYEHLLMAETPYVFGLVLTAAAGTLYTLERSWARLAFLCFSLFFLSAARPEGKLLLAFAVLLLLLLHVCQWRKEWPRIAILLVFAMATHVITRTAQAGLLLYTSVARFTPKDLKSAPGFEPYIAPIRADMQKRWVTKFAFPNVGDRRQIDSQVDAYLKTAYPRARHGHDDVNALCLKIATETCRRSFFQLPAYCYQKFRYGMREPSYGLFDRYWVFERQLVAFALDTRGNYPLGRELTGRPLNNEADCAAFLDAHYQELAWFNNWAEFWNNAVSAIRLPDERWRLERGYLIRPRLPIVYLLAGAGLIVIMLRRGRLQPFHIAWGLTLLGLYYTTFLTANLRGRFRFGLEPFWFLYAALLLDTLWHWCYRIRPPEAKSLEPAPVARPVS